MHVLLLIYGAGIGQKLIKPDMTIYLEVSECLTRYKELLKYKALSPNFTSSANRI